MAKIAALKTFANEVDEDIVKLAEEVLAEAKRGEMSGLAVVYVAKDGKSLSRASSTTTLHALTGAVAHLLHDLLHR